MNGETKPLATAAIITTTKSQPSSIAAANKKDTPARIYICCSKNLNRNGQRMAKRLVLQLCELCFDAKLVTPDGGEPPPSSPRSSKKIDKSDFLIEIAARPETSPFEGPANGREEQEINRSRNNTASNRVRRTTIYLGKVESLLEQTLRILMPSDFDTLPLITEGESKIVRQWTDKVVVIKSKPTVYSYTMNRYGTASGTGDVRMKFSAMLFRRMQSIRSDDYVIPYSAFLAEVPSKEGPLLAERKADHCNVEVRVKRYHIGSPVHRYRYTKEYGSTQRSGPIDRWSRFDSPIVCFDWRNPLRDKEGNRLADEPISDDYAAVWMKNVGYAKEMARKTFLWLEEMFRQADLCLIDMCIFIDREGKMIYGEISPDCMRVRFGTGDDPSALPSGDKDLWRTGSSEELLLANYEKIYQKLNSLPTNSRPMDTTFTFPQNYSSRKKGRKVSPAGMIDLPLDARIALGFTKGNGKMLRVRVGHNEVRISSRGEEGVSVRASPRCLLQLPPEAHKVLSHSQKGRYDMEISEKENAVYLRPA
jgi:phosphoribosylaminoimidazole-succinocarboxamide synthase